MTKLTCLLFLVLIGCGATEIDRVKKEVYITKGSMENGTLKLALVNGTKNKIFYEHWFGQTGSPVAYCSSEDYEIYVCSKEVFLLEDQYYTHETVMSPKEKVFFSANVVGAKRVGIKLYKFGESTEEEYIWVSIVEGT